MKINSKTILSNPDDYLTKGLDHGCNVVFRNINDMVELFGDKYGVEKDEPNGTINYNSKTGFQLSFSLDEYRKIEGKSGTIMRRPSQAVIDKQGEAAAEYCIHVGRGTIGYIWLPLFTMIRLDNTNEALKINHKSASSFTSNDLTDELEAGDDVTIRSIDEIEGEYGKLHNISIGNSNNGFKMIYFGETNDSPQHTGINYKRYVEYMSGKNAKVIKKISQKGAFVDPYTEYLVSIDGDKAPFWLPLKFFKK